MLPSFKYSKTIKCLLIIGFLFILLGFKTSASFFLKDGKKPNIVLIVADDLGYSDIGYFGSEIETPNLDKMAANGTVFPNCYNFSRCSPTRASILTGLYPQKVGVGELAGRNFERKLPGYKGYLSTEYPSLAEVLEKHDYHNMMCGKWHLGNYTKKIKTPRGRGFHDFFGLNNGETTHFNKCSQEDRRLYYLQDELYEKCDDDFYSSNAFTDFAIKFLDNKDDNQPFFLYLPYTAPHHPFEAPDSLIQFYREKYTYDADIAKIAYNRVEKLSKNIDINYDNYIFKFNKHQKAVYEKDKKKYLDLMFTRSAMVHNLDQNIGRILKHLEQKGVLDNTIIMYVSDNGGSLPMFDNCLLNAPYYGRKTSLTEGGIKTPMIIYNPKEIKHRINNSIVSVMDIFPTLLSLLNIDFTEHDDVEKQYKGMDISAGILGNQNIHRPYLFWDSYEMSTSATIKDSRWKWIHNKNGKDLLFDLKNDPFENHNIQADYQELLKQIKSAHQQFKKANHVEPYPPPKKKKVVAPPKKVGPLKKKAVALPPIDQLKKSTGETFGIIKTINDKNALSAKQPLRITEDVIKIIGGAIDSNNGTVAAGVYVKIGDQLFEAKYGLTNNGIVRRTKREKYLKSGFSFEIPTNKLKGKYDISILVVSSDRKTYYEQKNKVKVKIK